MSSSRKKLRFHVKHPVVVDTGCSCRRPKLSSFFSSSSSSSTSPPPRTSRRRGRMEGGSVAVEKESSDPYVDFRDSMVQMIAEKEMRSWDDLTELLHLFLSLNSPCHHKTILQAFGDILNGLP